MGISVPDKLKELVDHFDNNLSQIKSQQYNETQARREFIDPLFTLLGWDVDNKQGYAEAYKDVIHEDAIKVGGFTKAPDYCFRIGGSRKFFVEAKKPGVNIKEDIDPAYQLRRYAWSSKLPLSILTDFEEFAVYDCRTKPNPADKSSVGRVRYVSYTDYIKEWDYLVSTFSREAVLKGSFDKYVESNKAKKGSTEVDKAFLTEIEAWRDALARNIALRNPSLSTRELNFAVQATIDRIIFLRICEDRGVEDYARLMALQNGEGVYSRLMKLFRDADEKYNSGLFHFEPEKGRETHDSLTPILQLDDKVLKELIKSLYYPQSPYEFSVIPADILGQVYEQFLGKVIRLTAGHQAKVEDKPEVKKAGGVYYTPTYIVEYIVKNTVGKILEGKTPAEISKADHPVRILDPACGSGSFLLGAYEYLLTWYRDQYIKTGPEKYAKDKEPKLYESAGGAWKLTTSERKRILLSHIYGVDIDSQAVEVTKLSLLLKVLEGETKDSVSTQRRLFNERALPDLSNNIKCGNSLIGSDFYKDKQLDLFNEEERIRINAFDWEEEFPAIFKTKEGNGGFDAVIGNPPWGAELDDAQIAYFRRTYRIGASDSYALFIEAGLRRTSSNGCLSFITPDTFLRKDGYEAVRRFFLEENIVQELTETGPVFSGVPDTWCLVFRLKRALPGDGDQVKHQKISRFVVSAEGRLDRFAKASWDDVSLVKQRIWMKQPQLVVGYLASEAAQAIVAKMERCPRLGDLMQYRVSRGEEGSKFGLVEAAAGDFNMVIPADVFRYRMMPGIKVRSGSLAPGKLSQLYSHPKIWIIRIQKMRWKQRIVCTLDERQDSAGMKTLQVVVSGDGVLGLKYLQGILASLLINFWCINYLADDMNKAYLEQLPIRTIDFTDKQEKSKHDKMVSLVSSMLSLHKQLQSAKTEQDKTIIQRQINSTDKEIDRLVYELYELTPEEIKIVEGAQ